MTQTAEFDIGTPGMLEVLSVGKGDLRITVGSTDDDREKAKDLIQEMFRKGYAVFVEVDGELSRVKRFNPKKFSYVIGELVDPPQAPAPKGPTNRRTRERDIPVAGSRATAVGRTAGG
jgi:hypothetical protein